MFFPPLSPERASFLLLGGSAVAGYAAVRGLIDALVSGNLLSGDATAPAKRAIVHASLTAIVSLAAIFHHPALLDIAVGVPFAASVAALTFALGVVLFVASAQASDKPLRSSDDPRVNPRRVWAFVLPTGLIALLIGFSGSLAPSSCLILAVEGAAILLVSLPTVPRSHAAGSNSTEGIEQAPRRNPVFIIAQAFTSAVLMLLAGWGLVQGAAGLAMYNPTFRPGVAAVLALGPAIVVPMIPPLATLAERGRLDEAMSSIIGFALINLCLVLPLVAAARYLSIFTGTTSSVLATTSATQPSALINLPFPILVWRLDTVLLSTVGLLLLPVAIGKWTLSRAEGMGLIGIYLVYLFLTLLISRG